MKRKNNYEYTKVIKLAPALGDWTSIQYRDTTLDEIQITPVLNVNFDSLGKNRLKQLHYLHYRLAEKITQKLSTDMNIKIELHTVAATQMSYDDFLNTQEDKVVQSDFVLPGLGRFNVILEWSLADMLVNRLTGGKGEETKIENFSEIEVSMLEIQLQQLLDCFLQVWQKESGADALEANFNAGLFKRDKRVTLREAYVIFTFYLGFGKGRLKKIVWAYPTSIVKSLLMQLEQGAAPLEQNVVLSPEHMKKETIDVVAILGKAQLTMHDLKNLQKGDIIPLESKISSPLELIISNGAKLIAQPGKKNNRLCAQIIFMNQEGQLKEPPLIKKSDMQPTKPSYQAPIDEVDSYTPIISQPHPLPEGAVDTSSFPYQEAGDDAQDLDADISEENEIVETVDDIDFSDDDTETEDDTSLQQDAMHSIVDEDEDEDDLSFNDDIQAPTETTTEPLADSQTENVETDESEEDDTEEDDFSWDDLDDDF